MQAGTAQRSSQPRTTAPPAGRPPSLPSREDSVLQAGGLAAQPAALVAGGATAGQGGAGGGEGGDEEGAEGSWRGEDGKEKDQ